MLKLTELFQTRAADFKTAAVTIYGKEETVQFLCLDLLWGQCCYQKLRFILVRQGDRLSILVSTDLTLDAPVIIELYGYRFKMECTFREMKQVIGAFGYRFWSASMPKLNRYRRKGEADPLEQVTDEQDPLRIRWPFKPSKASSCAVSSRQVSCNFWRCVFPGERLRCSSAICARHPNPLFRKLRLWPNCTNRFFACLLEIHI